VDVDSRGGINVGGVGLSCNCIVKYKAKAPFGGKAYRLEKKITKAQRVYVTALTPIRGPGQMQRDVGQMQRDWLCTEGSQGLRV